MLSECSILPFYRFCVHLQLVGEYMLYRNDQPAAEALHTVSCRLLLDIMPGLETSVIFQDNVCSCSVSFLSCTGSDIQLGFKC